ncbi:hypothetical protein SJAG_03341 [Schizosaccharomyces japonicus yFS275]|uniref:Uncharacterized protein n=1 Tax=Schizosaccharomyces japonicus (strain yFS275 / FY16936) TaxID=402676 RepID=B6K3Z4_SCHJY|nr:hypothetical protein SJAG_03341 [Schizosaccharomyces japonicus yFS275]EEB08201.1 hypothetical protein SJAG_03341 [Schizosaccharomyces japonicus yFS275]
MASFGEVSLLGSLSSGSKSGRKGKSKLFGVVATKNGLECAQQLAVEVEGQGIDLYSLKQQRLIASCPLPDKTQFSCDPVYVKQDSVHRVWACTCSTKTNNAWALLQWRYDETDEQTSITYTDLSGRKAFSLLLEPDTQQLMVVFEDGSVYILPSQETDGSLSEPVWSPLASGDQVLQVVCSNKKVPENAKAQEDARSGDVEMTDAVDVDSTKEDAIRNSPSSLHMLYATKSAGNTQYVVASYSLARREVVAKRLVHDKFGTNYSPQLALLNDGEAVCAFGNERLSVYEAVTADSLRLAHTFDFSGVLSTVVRIVPISRNFCTLFAENTAFLLDLQYGTVQAEFSMGSSNSLGFLAILKRSDTDKAVAGDIVFTSRKSLHQLPFYAPKHLRLADAVGKRRHKLGQNMTVHGALADGILTKSKNTTSLCEQVLKNMRIQDESGRATLVDLQKLAAEGKCDEFDQRFTEFAEAYQNEFGTRRRAKDAALQNIQLLPVSFVHAVQELLFAEVDGALKLKLPARETLKYLLRNRLFSCSALNVPGGQSVFQCLHDFHPELGMLLMERISDVSAVDIARALKVALQRNKKKHFIVLFARLDTLHAPSAIAILKEQLIPEELDSLFSVVAQFLLTPSRATSSAKLSDGALARCAALIMDCLGPGRLALGEQNLALVKDLHSSVEESLKAMNSLLLLLPAVTELIKHKRSMSAGAKAGVVYSNPQPKAVVEEVSDLATLLKKDAFMEKAKGKNQRSRAKNLDMTIGKYTVERLEI